MIENRELATQSSSYPILICEGSDISYPGIDR